MRLLITLSVLLIYSLTLAGEEKIGNTVERNQHVENKDRENSKNGFSKLTKEQSPEEIHVTILSDEIYTFEFELPVFGADFDILANPRHYQLNDLKFSNLEKSQALYTFKPSEGYVGMDSVKIRICETEQGCLTYTDYSFIFIISDTPYGKPYIEYDKPSLYSTITYEVLEGKTSVFLEDMNTNRTYYLWLTNENGLDNLPQQEELPNGFSLTKAIHTVNAKFVLPFDESVPLLNDNRGNIYIRIH